MMTIEIIDSDKLNQIMCNFYIEAGYEDSIDVSVSLSNRRDDYLIEDLAENKIYKVIWRDWVSLTECIENYGEFRGLEIIRLEDTSTEMRWKICYKKRTFNV
jgi:hypothetical protein